MATGRINLKTLDYYRFKKLIIDGNRDDYNSCSKEIKAFCDYVQTFAFRDDQFDEETDRCRFDEICCFYRQILASRRINPIDMRLKSGWWGDNKGTYSIGKIKPAALKELLITKAKDFARRQGATEKQMGALAKRIDGPGIFVFKHKERHCFQYVGRADKVITRCAEKLKQAYEGTSHEPLAALFIITTASDWEFYFTPVQDKDEETLLRILENDIILRHDCIWPHGLNFQVHIDSLIEVSEFRKSCQRHNWPPVTENPEPVINLDRIRKDIVNIKAEELMNEPLEEPVSETTSSATSSRRSSIGDVDLGSSAFESGIDLGFAPERPVSPLSIVSTATYTVESVNNAHSGGAPSPRPLPKHTPSGKENVKGSRAQPTPKVKGSPRKQKRPEWKGPLDKSESGSSAGVVVDANKSIQHSPHKQVTPHPVDIAPMECSPGDGEARGMWTVDLDGHTVELSSPDDVTDAVDKAEIQIPARPADLPIKSQKHHSATTPKKIPQRSAAPPHGTAKKRTA